MNFSEIISLSCAIISLVATILIGIWQIFQNDRINKMTIQYQNHEERKQIEAVDIMARDFISKYHDSIGLLPLCAIAVAYNKTRPYSRKMYSDFRLLPRDTRLKVFDYCGWQMCDIDSDSFFTDCLLKLEIAVERFLPKENFNSMFHSHGKYIENAIKIHADKGLSYLWAEREDVLSDILSAAFRDNNFHNTSVISQIMDTFSFISCSDDIACQIACFTAKYISIYAGQKLDIEREEFIDCGSPGAWAGEEITSMEDLFLLTLFEIWSNLWDIERR